MTEFIFAHPSPFDVSITLVIFDNWEQLTRCTFPLRNLAGQNEAEHVEEAAAVMVEVAAELHYITGYGIDRGTIRLNGKKAQEVVFEEYAPHSQTGNFIYGVKIGFLATRSYQWVNGRHHSWRLAKSQFNEDWQRQIWEQNRTASFRLPCMVAAGSPEHQDRFFSIAAFKKRRRKTTGWVCKYDQADVVFNRFINRFYEEGNLAIGTERYWSKPDSYVIDGINWLTPKFKIDKVPRKSKLASRPTDETDYVYLIRAGRTKLYKIGKSNDPQKRLASMQTASPFKLKLVHVFKADNATAAEEALHRRLHENRKEGEWFELTDGQQKIISSITAYEAGLFIIEERKLSAEEIFPE